MSFLNKFYSAGDTVKVFEEQAVMQNIQAIYKIDKMFLVVSCFEDSKSLEVLKSVLDGFMIIRKQTEYIKNNYP